MDNFIPQGVEDHAPQAASHGVPVLMGVLLFVVGLAIGAVAMWYFGSGTGPALEPVEPTATPEPTPLGLEAIFRLEEKEPGTELYYSEELGVGFTYLVPSGLNSEANVVVNEFGDTITVFGQSIEVFKKNVTVTFKEAIELTLLRGYDPAKCFVVGGPARFPDVPDGYSAAEISYPQELVNGEPAWLHHECPPKYSQTNGVLYFLYNDAVPDKFLFVSIGQDSPASDGTPRTAEGGFNWTHSIRILE